MDSGAESEDITMTSNALRLQKQLCDEAMELMNAGVALQNANPPKPEEAGIKLDQALDVIEKVLAIEFTTEAERDASRRLATKMSRYAKIIASQRQKHLTPGNATGHHMVKSNILDMKQLPSIYDPIAELLRTSNEMGDIFDSLKKTFGFQDASALNQKEHVLLLLTNFKEQAEDDFNDGKKKKKGKKDASTKQMEHQKRDPQAEMELAKKGIKRFHTRLFANYVKWCKYISTKPAFTSNQLVDIVLFFLIWGEAGNFRQVPEALCFLLHNMLPQAMSRGESKPPGAFLNEIIRPMYDELKKDNDKKTAKGARASHAEIRNYDDFNEFFWTKKCLKFNATTIAKAFGEVDKKGFPKTVKKSYIEKRMWLRALFSFRRIFLFNIALFFATIGLALNVIMFCPDTPILYGPDVTSTNNTRQFTVFGKSLVATDKFGQEFVDDEEDDLDEELCILPMLANCLGIDFTSKKIFTSQPVDFKATLSIIPFTHCIEKGAGRCGCYLDLLDKCFSESGTTSKLDDEEEGVYISQPYDQSKCLPIWKKAVESTINDKGPGKLNCGVCNVGFMALIKNMKFVELMIGLITPGSTAASAPREDQGALAMFAGLACVALVFACEFLGSLTSFVGSTYVGRSLPVPFSARIRYTCFWLFLFTVKLTFDYKFMVKSLVETSLFIWYAREDEYLPYSQLMIQASFHNIIYIFFLWVPAFMVFMYDAQIFYAIISVMVGSIRGFNLRIGELRSFRVLRLSFKQIPRLFNKKMVSNLQDDEADTSGKKKNPKKGKKKNGKDVDSEGNPVHRYFERISMADGSQPLTTKSLLYSRLLEHDAPTPQVEMDNLQRDNPLRSSATDSVTGMSGAAFERTIPFAMAWNRCLVSLRESDVISNRELNVLSYLIDSIGAEHRRLYPPAFLTAGKLDESIEIITQCGAVHSKLSNDKKKKEKALQKIENTMRERLIKDDLRIQALIGSYKFTSQAILILLGDQHNDLKAVFDFVDEMVAQKKTLTGLNVKNLHQTRTSCADLMKAILDVPKEEETSVNFQKALYHVIDCMEIVLGHAKNVVKKQEHLVEILNGTPLKQNSFFFPGDSQQYASQQLKRLVFSDAAMDIVSRAHQLLTVDNMDAEPRSLEGRRRLRFFANSLFMEMPDAKPIRKVRSLTVSTPYYNEIVMYSVKDLTTQNDDSMKLLYYLQTIYPHEWTNVLERLQAKDMDDALKRFPEEIQLWASYRGQTLARTCRGMMFNEEAIRFLHWLEICENEEMHLQSCRCNKCIRLDDMVAMKFNYICSCQIYGKQKENQAMQAADLEFLLKKHKNLRIAYVDGPVKAKEGPPKYFSVLIRSYGDDIAEVYRVELPGNPILGEGKPENQNHAVIFSRGELLQCIDMNQDGYLEECLKMPNLLSTLDQFSDKAPVTIIGFREHVFTGGVSNLASFMSIQELSFVSLGQRMLAWNHVRQHYGHPDIFDKIFAMGTGGTAKATKGVNLSEDIFAGFNTTLRGGRVTHEEFIQVGKGRDVGMQQLAQFEAKISSGAGECVVSRDCARMAGNLDFWRLHSWFYGNLGWYFTQTMTVVGIYFFIYGKVYMALSGMDSYFLEKGGLGIGGTLNTSWAFQFGFLLVAPVIAVVGVERGFRHGVTYLLWNIMTLGPLFFTFQMGTRMHYFDKTLVLGGAKYRATGRGFTIKHEKFAELYRFYAFSHFYRGVELVFLLILFYNYGTFSWCNCSWTMDLKYYNNFEPSPQDWKTRCYANYYQNCVEPTNQNYTIMSYSLWIIAATWLWAPFMFNPSGLDYVKLIEDFADWQTWLNTSNDSTNSWLGWWQSELEYLEHAGWQGRLVSMLRKMRFLALSYGLYLQMAHSAYYESRDMEVTKGDLGAMVLSMAMGALIIFWLVVGYVASRVSKKMTSKQKRLRKMKFVLFWVGLVLTAGSLMFISIKNLFELLLVLILAVYWFLQVCIYRLQFSHIVVRAIARSFDRLIGWLILGPMIMIAMFLPFLSSFQQRVMFNNAFTSGLEVSKLFAHTAASNVATKVVKLKRAGKKKKRHD